jgi:hypothetical protein
MEKLSHKLIDLTRQALEQLESKVIHGESANTKYDECSTLIKTLENINLAEQEFELESLTNLHTRDRQLEKYLASDKVMTLLYETKMISPSDYSEFLLEEEEEEESRGHCGPADGAGRRNKEVSRDEDAKRHPKQLKQLTKVYRKKKTGLLAFNNKKSKTDFH